MTATNSRFQAPSSLNQLSEIAHRVDRGRQRRTFRYLAINVSCVTLLLILVAIALCVGETTLPLSEVIGAMLGTNESAQFTVNRLRVPKTTIAIAAGFAFGISGRTFQVLLRNPLASPDIIGITSGTTTAAVFAVLLLGWSGLDVSAFAIAIGLVVAAAIWKLSNVDGRFSSRMILIGIGTGALFQALTSWLLVRANSQSVPEAMRWLTGSLSTAAGMNAVPLLISVCVLGILLVLNEPSMRTLVLGRELAISLGQPHQRNAVVLVGLAVALAAVATASTGPIAFVAFLAGPIAAMLVGHNERSLLVTAGLVGAILVLGSDALAQSVLPYRYPVGVVTGLIGAPVLIAILIRTQRKEISA